MASADEIRRFEASGRLVRRVFLLPALFVLGAPVFILLAGAGKGHPGVLLVVVVPAWMVVGALGWWAMRGFVEVGPEAVRIRAYDDTRTKEVRYDQVREVKRQRISGKGVAIEALALYGKSKWWSLAKIPEMYEGWDECCRLVEQRVRAARKNS